MLLTTLLLAETNALIFAAGLTLILVGAIGDYSARLYRPAAFLILITCSESLSLNT